MEHEIIPAKDLLSEQCKILAFKHLVWYLSALQVLFTSEWYLFESGPESSIVIPRTPKTHLA